MAESLTSFEDSLGRMAHHSETFDRHMSHSGISITQLIKGIIGGELAWKAFNATVAQSALLSSFKRSITTLNESTADLVKTQKQYNSDLAELNAFLAGRIVLEGKTVEMARIEAGILQRDVNLIQAQLNLKQTMAQMRPLELGFYAIVLSSATAVFHAHRQINSSLIEANSTLSDRLRLTKETLAAQRMTGTEFQTSIEAARDLVEYGFDMSGNYQEALQLVIQLKDGLGVASKLGAELAVVYERQLETSARAVADSMASVLNDTALAADQAARMAVNIGRAVAMLRPGANGDLSAVVDLVGRYEGALQSLGGQFGGFQELLTKMTTPEGLLQAGVLGVSNPEFLKSEQATKQVIDSFADYARSFLGDADGWDRAMRLQALSEMFGTTAAQVNLMMKAVEDANGARKSAITLEERFDEQLRASGQSFTRLTNALVAFGQEAAIPLMHAATQLFQPVAWAVEELMKLPGVVTTATIIFGVGAAFAAARLYSLAKALVTVAAAAHASAIASREKAAADALSALGSGGAAARSPLMMLIGRLPTLMTAAVGAGLAGWAVGSLIGKWVDKRIHEDNYKHLIPELTRSFDAAFNVQVRRQAATGDVAGVLDSIKVARDHFLNVKKLSVSETESRIANVVKQLPELAGKMRFTKEVAAGYLGRTEEQQRGLDVIERGQSSLIEIASKQVAEANRQNQIYKEQLRQEEKRQEEETRNRRLMYSKTGIFSDFTWGPAL